MLGNRNFKVSNTYFCMSTDLFNISKLKKLMFSKRHFKHLKYVCAWLHDPFTISKYQKCLGRLFLNPADLDIHKLNHSNFETLKYCFQIQKCQALQNCMLFLRVDLTNILKSSKLFIGFQANSLGTFEQLVLLRWVLFAKL